MFDSLFYYFYMQGESLGMDKQSCDSGFRSEVINICGPNKDCIRDGAQFLWFIKSDHKFNYRYEPQCADTCIRDFIIGANNFRLASSDLGVLR